MVYIRYFSEEIEGDRQPAYSQAIEKTTSQDPQMLMVIMVSNNEEK